MSADEIILDSNSGGSGTPREQHPIGQHIGVCVDVIDLGERLEEFAGKPRAVKRKITLVFMTGLKNTEGEYFEISREFTFSSHEKAGLRKFLGEWRGTPLTEDEIKQGMRLSAYAGKPAILAIVAKPSKKGTVYSNLNTATPLFPGLEDKVPALPPYTRAAFWAKRKEEYADGVAEFKRQEAVKAGAQTPTVIAPPATPVQKAIAEAAADASVAKAIAAVEADDSLVPF